jgi:RNA polymerase sigma factor (TIGR02999 family)
MRRILTDFARSRWSLKRGGGALRISFGEDIIASQEPCADVLALDDALNSLATLDPRKAQVLELRFFGGLSVEEAAEVLKVSPETVKRDWKLSKLWLLRKLSEEQRHEA